MSCKELFSVGLGEFKLTGDIPILIVCRVNVSLHLVIVDSTSFRKDEICLGAVTRGTTAYE